MKTVKRSNNFVVLFFMITLLGFITPFHSFADGGGVYTPFDRNRDGFLDQEEFKVFLQKRRIKPAYVHLWNFEKVDLDKDKKISQAEMSRTLNTEMEFRLNKQQNRMDSRKGRGPGMGRNMPTFADMDSDGDGKLTPEEFKGAQIKHRQDRQQR